MVTPEVPRDDMDDPDDGMDGTGDGVDGPGEDPETTDEAVQEPDDVFKERLRAAAQRKLMATQEVEDMEASIYSR